MHALLFDIDGTLLRSGGAGQAAMERALESVFGVTAPTEGISAAGRTDFAITSDLLDYHRKGPTITFAQAPHVSVFETTIRGG